MWGGGVGWGGQVWGVRVDVNEELKFFFLGGGASPGGGDVRLWGSGWM